MSKIANKPNTTDKSLRDIDKHFDQKDFNNTFNKNEEELTLKMRQNKSEDMTYHDEILDNKLPHQKPVEDIIITIRDMFYHILELLIDKQNPIPYIFSSYDRYFAFAIFLLIIGSILLLLSNLMISSDK